MTAACCVVGVFFFAFRTITCAVCPPAPLVERYRAGCPPDPPKIGVGPEVGPLTNVCPSSAVVANQCEGRFGIPTGSGGAQIASFHTLKLDPEAKKLRIEWKCPGWDGQVRIIVRIAEYTTAISASCKAERVEWPTDRFLTYGIRRAQPTALVEVWNGNSPCRIPIHLLAHMTIPNGLFRRAESPCNNTSDSNACLVIESRFAADNHWEIGTGGERVLKIGFGRMGSQSILIRRPMDCKPIDLTVDFDRAASAKPTCIGEIRF
jgi:hypothetical protein